MSMWSKNNLNVEFNTIANDWFEENKSLSDEKVISSSIDDYLANRKALFLKFEV
jgi:hypothetical protein